MYSALNQTASVGIALAYPIWEAEEDCFYAPRFIEPAIYTAVWMILWREVWETAMQMNRLDCSNRKHSTSAEKKSGLTPSDVSSLIKP